MSTMDFTLLFFFLFFFSTLFHIIIAVYKWIPALEQLNQVTIFAASEDLVWAERIDCMTNPDNCLANYP
jgi:hypothetical protein